MEQIIKLNYSHVIRIENSYFLILFLLIIFIFVGVIISKYNIKKYKTIIYYNLLLFILISFLSNLIYKYWEIIRDNYYHLQKIITQSGFQYYLLAFLITIIFFTVLPSTIKKIFNMFNSIRFDYLVSIIFAINYVFLTLKLHFSGLLIITVYIVFMLILIIYRDKNIISISNDLITSDDAIKDEKENILFDKEDYEFFARLAISGKKNESLSFGLDAPWGYGKSSYLNLCKKNCWENKEWVKDKKIKKPIIYEFKIHSFDSSKNILLNFVEGLFEIIDKESFFPEINTDFNKIIKILSNLAVNVNGININFPVKLKDKNVHNIINEDLRNKMKLLDRKIIVIIDDLDRATEQEIKTTIDIVKHCFGIPNMNYILCYNSANLNKIYIKNNISNYMEKIVNVNHAIIFHKQNLISYLKKEKEYQILNNIIAKLLEDDYLFFKIYISDIRKIKRIINICKLRHIEDEKIIDSDHNPNKIFLLLLLLLKYPEIFRDILNTEDREPIGPFSELPYLENLNIEKKDAKSNTDYNNYIENIDEDAKNLIDLIFSKQKDTYFAGGNIGLKRDLNLLVYGKAQNKSESKTKYNNEINNLINKQQFTSKELKKIFNELEKESFVKKFLLELNNFIKEETKNVLHEFYINNLIHNSIIRLNSELSGNRDLFIYNLLNVINCCPNNNLKENIDKIKSGIFETLEKMSKNINLLKIYDILIFRLSCSDKRSGDLNNIYQALGDGDINKNEKDLMEEISIECFEIFKKNYIDEKVNIFEETDKDEFKKGIFGNFEKSWDQYFKENKINKNDIIEATKFSIIDFILFQIGSDNKEFGISCGNYEFNGKSIKYLMSQYLFETCFKDNYKYFVNFMLSRFELNLSEKQYLPNIEKYKIQFDQNLLKNYWKNNQEKIKEFIDENAEEEVITYNYTAVYKKDFELVKNELKKLFDNNGQ